MNQDPDSLPQINSYWKPSLGSSPLAFPQQSSNGESFWRSFWRFSHHILYYFFARIFSLRRLPGWLIRFSWEVKCHLRDFALKKLLARRGYMFRPTSHATILSLSFALLFLGGASGNVILGRGEAQGVDFSYEDDTLERVIITRTDLPEGRVSNEVITYTVKDGDTLSGIGEKFRVSAESIRYANDMFNVDSLKIGLELKIPPISGVVATVKSGDTVESIANKFSVSPQAIVDFNYLKEPFELTIGQEIVVPDASIPSPVAAAPSSPSSGTATAYPQEGVSGSGNFGWPTDYRYVSQYFSSYHPAIDIAKTSPLYASDGGTVIEVANGGWNWGYGLYVKIDHGNGYTTMYAHMSKIYVSVGDVVGKGQGIGMMGNTGNSFGTHVHFIVQYHGQFINPLSVL